MATLTSSDSIGMRAAGGSAAVGLDPRVIGIATASLSSGFASLRFRQMAVPRPAGPVYAKPAGRATAGQAGLLFRTEFMDG